MQLNITEKEILDYPNDAELGAYIRNKYFDSKKYKDLFDKCVMCGKDSPYKISTHIDLRYGYIEGVGQGCFSPKTCDK